MSAELQSRPTEEILKEIAELQEIQKYCPQSSPKWQAANAILRSLFDEMAESCRAKLK